MPLEWSHAVADVPASPREFKREATAVELAMLTSELAVLACSKLSASYTIKHLGGSRYKVMGACKVDVEQSCIVSLEPVPASVTLPIEVEFAPDPATTDATTSARRKKAGRDAEPEPAEVEVSSLPEIEPIQNGQLDVGRVIFETLIEVASGKKTKSEAQGLGDETFAPWTLGPVL